MDKAIPVEKNKEYIIDITSMGYEGEGVGKVNDFTVFVSGALLNEKVKIKIIKISKNFAFGKLMEVVEPSKHRKSPVCGIYKRCGGCQLQHFSYEAQLEFKRKRVEDCMERIGKLNIIREDSKKEGHDDINKDYKGIILHNVIGMDNPYRYRNKVQLPVGQKDGEIRIGFYAQRSHEIIHMDDCSIQDETADKVVEIIKRWIENYKVKPYNEENHSGVLRHIMVRRAFETGEVMVVLVTRTNELPYKDKLVDLILKEIDGMKSIIQNINDKKTNVVLGQKSIVLWGQDTICDYIGKYKFNISPLSFFQVNPVQTEVLYNKALEYANLSGQETVFDAYCGTGTISLFLSEKAKKVYGVEIIPEAIENAKINAEQNNVNNAEFIVGQSEQVIPELIRNGIRAEVVVVDPPRKGCEKSLLEAIAKMEPRRVVYVSCDPGTLARDLAILNDFGYKTIEIQPVDMFPQTAHVECVALIVKKNQ